MMERQNLTFFLVDANDSFQEPLSEFLTDIQTELAKVPQEYRGSVLVDLEFEGGSGGDYGEPGSVRFSIFWQRSETDLEYETRKSEWEARQKKEVELYAKRREQAERSELARLLRKYPK